MLDYSSRYWQIPVAEAVVPSLEKVRLEHQPLGESAFALGLRAGYYGEWFDSVHVPVPQVEKRTAFARSGRRPGLWSELAWSAGCD